MNNYIYWEIRISDNSGLQLVDFYLERDGVKSLVCTEELEDVIGDYVEQREDEWVKGDK